MFLVPACHRPQKPEKKQKTLPHKIATQHDLAAISEREKSFNQALNDFINGREFNEKNFYDLLTLIALEIETIDHLRSGPRWLVRETINEKKEHFNNAIPTIQNIYTMCLTMTDYEIDEKGKEPKDDYLKSVRASLKRSYAKVKSLENSLQKTAPSYITPLVAPAGETISHPSPEPQKVSGSTTVKKEIEKLDKITRRLENFQQNKDLINTEIPEKLDDQVTHLHDLIGRLKRNN